MSATAAMAKGTIVDIRWGSQTDRRWLRENVPSAFLRQIKTWPQWFRREMSVYRCCECGAYGALEGIGPETLLMWSAKGQRCSACQGCTCEDCRPT